MKIITGHKADFNIVFKSTSKLADIARRSAARKSGTSEKKTENHNHDETYGAIYMATCKKCIDQQRRAVYIGETGRSLKVRILEHFKKITEENIDLGIVDNGKTSAIGLHDAQLHGTQPCRENWNFKVLRIEKITQHRKALEAVAINRFKPNLNRNKGVIILPLTVNTKLREVIEMGPTK